MARVVQALVAVDARLAVGGHPLAAGAPGSVFFRGKGEDGRKDGERKRER